jgi:predicted NBD/HSP70 family sugar kinase
MPEDLHPPWNDAGCGPLVVAPLTAQTPLKQQIFECVRAAGSIPRVEVARQIGVSPASVTSAVQDLISAGLVEEIETRPRDGHRGRPPVALSVRGESGFVVGLKLSDETHSAVVLDLAGRIRGEATLGSTQRMRETEILIGEAADLLRDALVSAGATLDDVRSVGIGLPGSVDHASGWVYWSPILSDEDVDFRARAAKALGTEVTIDNDANVVTLAELWFGAGRQKSDFAVVTIEHGVGMGMVIDHALYRGAHGLAMELGHIKVQLDGALCRCGQRGCLEAYLADYALVREASTALNWEPAARRSGPILLESLFDEAKAGNEAARMIFRRAGRFLAVALANVSNLFDPSLIILSGERMRYDYLYAETVISEMRSLSLNRSGNAPEIEINAWGGLVWARGAGAMALSDSTASVVMGVAAPE